MKHNSNMNVIHYLSRILAVCTLGGLQHSSTLLAGVSNLAWELIQEPNFSLNLLAGLVNQAVPVGSAMAVLMPMRRPLLSSNTPPELPGLIAASVWMTLRIGTPRAPAQTCNPRHK